MTKSQQLAERMHIQDFKASHGWLDNFKKRHGVVFKVLSGESSAVNPDQYASWLGLPLPNLLQNYKAEDVYNLDETGLFFRLLLPSTPVVRRYGRATISA